MLTDKQKLKIAVEALNKINILVPEDVQEDCVCCDYDGRINLKHHPECTYVIVSEALLKIKEST